MHAAYQRDVVQSGWSILCDFDGTIALDDVVDALLERYGMAGWEQLERRWRAGQIGSLECMRGQVELLDVSPRELDFYLDQVQIDPAFPAFVTKARSLAMPIRVASDGLDYVIQRILSRHGLADLPVIANRLVRGDAPDRWRLESPFAVEGCRSGTCKCRQLSATRDRRFEYSLLVGDGASDFCVAEKADFVFAKGHLVDYCLLHGIPHRSIAGFADALELLPTLTDPAPALPRTKSRVQSPV